MVADGPVIRAVQLRDGDMFETLLTGAAGTYRPRTHGEGGGVPVELWYPDGREVVKMLAPQIRVRLLGRGEAQAA